VRPRISLEETTPLHKQRNCGGVRASVASTSLGKNGRESERGREGGREKERIAFITIVTKRLHPSRERNQRKRKLPRVRMPRFSVPFFIRIQIRVRGHVHACACTAYTRQSTIFSRGANMRTRTPLSYVLAYCALFVPTENFNDRIGGAKFSCAY